MPPTEAKTYLTIRFPNGTMRRQPATLPVPAGAAVVTTDVEIAELMTDPDAPDGNAAWLAELAAEADAALAGVEVAELA